MLPSNGRPFGPGGKGGFWGRCICLMIRKDSEARMTVTMRIEADMLKDKARSLWYGVISRGQLMVFNLRLRVG